MKSALTLILIVVAAFGCSDTALLESSIGIKDRIAEVKVDVPEVYVSSKDESVSKKNNGDVYLNEELFSGYIVSKYENGVISIKKGYVDGKQNGITTAYYQDGTTQYVRPYLDGEKHGVHIGFHKNGQKSFEYYFENGFNEGNHLKWYNDGQKASDMNYLNGKEFGRQQAWRPDGKLRSNYIVRENGRMYGLQGIKRCTKLDGVTKTIDPYKGNDK